MAKFHCVLSCVVFSLLLVTVDWGSVAAQDAGPPPGVPWMSELLQRPDVYEDLELVDFQRETISRLMADRKSATAEFARMMRSTAPEERAELLRKFKSELVRVDGEMEAVLLPLQRERLNQLRLQLVAKSDPGTFGLQNKEFLARLNLTEDQKAEIAAKAAELQKGIEKKIRELQAEIEKVKAEARDELIKVLTPEQRKIYAEMIGRPLQSSQK